MIMIKKILLTLSLLFSLAIFSMPSFAATLITPATQTKTVDYQAVVTQMDDIGDDLVNRYQAQNGMDTMQGFSNLYFDHYEGTGMELAVTAISPTINTKTEALFTHLIGSASNGANPEEIQKTWVALKIRLNADLALLNSNTASTFTEAFLQAFGILLREGFEALIIVTALLTYLRRSQHANQSKTIHYGVGLALVASAITAYLFATIFKNLGANREAMEGLTMLAASAVMFYVSYWLFSKRDANKWQGFLKNKVSQALSSSNTFALGLTAFLAVYREGAETILFYQALIIGSKGQSLGILAGFGAACLALLIVYRGMQTASFKIPYRLFFTATALLLYYMSFSFIGGAILELQEAGWVDITPINNFPQIEWLGIFPAWQNVGAQLIFIVPTLGLLIWWYARQFMKKGITT